MLVVRHSERIDEVLPNWRNRAVGDEFGRGRLFVKEDPPITHVGHHLAKSMAKTIYEMLPYDMEVRVYSSRLLRCVQTATYLAEIFDVPLYVSSGLSLTAMGVRNCNAMKDKNGKEIRFKFLTTDQLQQKCPTVRIITCDDKMYSENFVPNQNWLSAITAIATRKGRFINIVVAHRETLWSLSRFVFPTPYCCFGYLKFEFRKVQCETQSKKHRKLGNESGFTWYFDSEFLNMYDRVGNEIKMCQPIPKQKGRQTRTVRTRRRAHTI